MSKHNEKGALGEQIALEFLKNKNYKIIATNWRHAQYEIDIIAEFNDYLIFVEVKTRSSFDFGFPEEAVNLNKQKSIIAGATAFIEQNPTNKLIQFDIISVLLKSEQSPEIKHFEDAFF